MAHLLPPRVFFFGMPWMVILIAVGVAVLFAAKRRSCRRVPTVLPLAQPTLERMSGRGSMRRSIWGVVILLIVLAAVFQGVYVQRNDTAKVETDYGRWYTTPPDMTQMTVELDARPVVPAKTEPPRKKPWFKAPSPAPPEPPKRPWQATIDQSTFPSVPSMNPRDKFRDTIVHRLQDELHLHTLPPPRFADNPIWVSKVEMERKTLEEKDPNYGEVEVIRYEVELTAEGWSELGRLERADRAAFRMELAALGLGLFTTLLGVIAAYVRLDEWTKGYYSGRLLLAAVALVAGVGFVLATHTR